MPRPQSTVCTAIPYVNSTPHIGNILTDLCGDITARYLRLRGHDVFFQVGTDENGLKIKEAAEAAGRDVHEYVREIAGRFREIFDEVGISYDAFIRTTDLQHIVATQSLFRALQDNGHIYLGTYEGWYDVSTETFFREEDLVEGKSPDGNEVRWVSEENYFFRLSAFGDRLLELVEHNPSFVRPENRRREVLSFIQQGLRDVCITRKNPGWGVPVPGRDDLVVYVWFDALVNYISVTGYPKPGYERLWPSRVQWVGKDILTRFHATLWPAMLMGAGLPVFETVVAHGWVLLGGDKMSKSKGNVVRPLELADELAERAGIGRAIAVDAVRHYLSATMSLEADSTFTYEDFDLRYNADLANDLGNALNRTLAMAHRFGGGVVPEALVEQEALDAVENARIAYEAAMSEYQLPKASEAAFGLVRFLNKYIDTRAPWALAKTGDPALGGVLRSMLTCIKAVEGLVRPFLPRVADQIAAQLGSQATLDWEDLGHIEPGKALGTPQPIFPRLEIQKVAPAPKEKKAKSEKKGKPAFEVPAEIELAEFMRVNLRVGRIVEAEPVEGSAKLVKLQVMVGPEKRQVVAGIRTNYEPIDLIGRQVVVVVNLKPATLMGLESRGMVLAADGPDGAAILVQPDVETPEGTSVH